MMWRTDSSRPEGSWPATREKFVGTMRGLPEADIAAMLGGRSLRSYDIDTQTLAPLVERIGPEYSEFIEA